MENDLEGKAVSETATERGREGISIVKDEVKARLAPRPHRYAKRCAQAGGRPYRGRVRPLRAAHLGLLILAGFALAE